MKIFSEPGYKNYNYMFSLFAGDVVAYLLAIFFAYETRILSEELFSIIPLKFSLSYFIFQLWWIFVIFLAFIASFGLYSKRMPFWKESREIFRAASATFVLVFAFVSLGKMTEDISRLMIVLLWFYSFLFTLIIRYFIKISLFRYGVFLENTIIIGSYEKAETVADSFYREPYLGFNVIGIVTTHKTVKNTKKKYKILGDVSLMRRIIIKERITAAVVVPDGLEKYDLSSIMGKLQIMLSKILLISDAKVLAFSNAETFQTLMGRLSYFQINNNLKSFVNRVTKRTIDLILAILAMTFVLLITIIIGISIKSTSKGPVFYTHARVGRNGKTIKIMKFRSMYKDADKRLREILKNDPNAKAEWEQSFKLKDDPRITPIGKFLRQTSLDELPQVFNVLVGDMSMIGPRPVLQEELDNYYKESANYYMMVRPGITGLWQISGRSNTGYDFRVSMDTWYVLNWSIWLDLVILLRTPAAVLKKDGAY